MSLPTTVVYVTLAVLIGPTLAQLGIVPLAAHVFLFYFGMLSLIMPPDCLATYAAAAIAKSGFWQTGWVGMRLGIVAYLVPFVFVYHPALILKGTLGEIVTSIFTASIGVILLGIGCAGYLFRPLGWTKRALFWVAGLLLFSPPFPGVLEGVLDTARLGLPPLGRELPRLDRRDPEPRRPDGHAEAEGPGGQHAPPVRALTGLAQINGGPGRGAFWFQSTRGTRRGKTRRPFER